MNTEINRKEIIKNKGEKEYNRKTTGKNWNSQKLVFKKISKIYQPLEKGTRDRRTTRTASVGDAMAESQTLEGEETTRATLRQLT